MTEKNPNYDQNKTAEAFRIIQQAMIGDSPYIEGSYAYSWYCNLAITCFDILLEHGIPRVNALSLCNEFAQRFMKLTFKIDIPNI